MKLTDAQQEAVLDSGGNLLVSAGAGTGKTRVLVERFLHLVISGKAPVTEILALTYTDKAAAEMKSRILGRLQELGRLSDRRKLESASISTIHAFAAKILREHPLEAGVAPDFRVIESEETDFFKEQALDSVLEIHCKKGTGIFDLLRSYGEPVIRAGLLEILDQSRHKGKTVREFIEAAAPVEAPPSPQAVKTSSFDGASCTNSLELVRTLFQDAGDAECLREWQRFETSEPWDWAAIEAYKAWRKTFTRKSKSPWLEIRKLTEAFLGWKLETLAQPWREAVASLACAFEETYENLKKEEGVLDFDDLQIRVVRLFDSASEVAERIRQVYRSQYQAILVDEFQDTSPLQLRLVEQLSRGDNLFLVGDYKQSIYAFRGAEPELFHYKEREYADPASGKRIPLLENFRTVPAVLNWINLFFEKLWREDGWNLETLKAGSESKVEGKVSVLAIPLARGEDKDYARMREADGIAAEIKALYNEGKGCRYGDIAILFEAMSDAAIYEYALKKAGIPYFSVSSRGFYQQPEIRDMISVLSFLENPFADIPLAAALRSPFFQVTDDTLFWLARHAKKEDSKAPFYRAVMDYDPIPEISESEKIKLAFFKSIAAELTLEKDKLRLTELLDKVLEKTGYELCLAAGADSVRRLANLKKLMAMARREETYGPLGLGDFLKRIKRLELQDVRESEAQIEAEASGLVVRLMTIHKAKGLEFPVVFVADMGRSSQKSDTAKIMAREGWGIGIQVRNAETLDWESPLGWQSIEQAAKIRKKEERKRLLYVAMTRAKEKLFLCGVLEEDKKLEGKSFYEMRSWMHWIESLEAEMGPFERVTPPSFLKAVHTASSDLDWNEVWGMIQSGPKDRAALQSDTAAKIKAQLAPRPVLPLRTVNLPVSAYAVYDVSPETYSRVYEIGLPEGWEESYEQRSTTGDVPVDAADFGTAMHALLERLDFKDPLARREELLTDCFSGMPPACRSEAEKILERFLRSELFKRLTQAKKFERELPFVLNERHGLIQGVIDVLFQDEQGDWHILDYKTAEGDEDKVKKRGYVTQIEMYAVACRRLLGKTPKTGILYFLKNQWQYITNFDPAALTGSEEKIRKIQEEILEYKNSLNPL